MDEKTQTDETVTTTPATTTPAVTDEGDVPATDTAATDGTTSTVGIVGTPSDKAEFFGNLTQDAAYLMGLSFLVGVLFTVFILLVFDFMRRNSSDTTTTTIK